MKSPFMRNVFYLIIAFTVSIGSTTISAQAVPPATLAAPEAPAGGQANPKAVMMYNLGITAYKQGSIDAAVIFFKRACDIDPNLADAQYNLAVIFQSQKRGKEAIPRFEEVLRIKPSDPDAHYQLGVILQDLGRPEDARQHLSNIAPNSPHFPDAQRRLAQLSSAPPQGQQYAAPPQTQQYAPASQSTNPFLQPANNNPPPVADNPFRPAPPPTGQAAYAEQPVLQPTLQPTTQPIAQPDQLVAVAQPPVTQPFQQPTPDTAAPVPTSAPVSPNPVPVLANATLRVVATGFRAPAGLSFDRNGYLYVANYLANTIDRIATDGTRTQFSSGTNLRGPIGVATDDLGNVYVANYNGGTVVKINPAGVSTIVAKDFKKPYYLTFDRDGNLYVSQQEDNSIVRITLPRPAAAAKP